MLICDTEHNIYIESATFFTVMLGVVVLSVIVLTVMAPTEQVRFCPKLCSVTFSLFVNKLECLAPHNNHIHVKYLQTRIIL